MSLGWFLGIWVAVVLVIGLPLSFLAMSRASSLRIADLTTPADPVQSFVGSMRWSRTLAFGVGSARIGFVRLDFFDRGIRSSGSHRVLRLFLPTIEIRYGGVSSAAAGSGGSIRSQCVVVRAPRADVEVMFWTNQVSELLDGFEERGVIERRHRPGSGCSSGLTSGPDSWRTERG